MTIQEIKSIPTCLAITNGSPKSWPSYSGQVHESVLRSYHLLRKTKEWLAGGVPGQYVLEMIADIEDAPTADPYVVGDR